MSKLRPANDRRSRLPCQSWLLLLYRLPATHKTARVAIWRKLQKSGAIQIKTSTYLLPDRPAQHELFQWLAKQVIDYGGDSTLIRAQEIEGLPDPKIVGLFNAARDSDYALLNDAARNLAERRPAKHDKRFVDGVEKLRKAFHGIREIDFFGAAKAHLAESQLDRLASAGGSKPTLARRLQAKEFQGRTWVTRPGPEIDRVACAWLIRRFIDRTAVFAFATDPDSVAGGIPFDYPDGEFSHHDEDCTFETLLSRFGINDKALRKISEMVHDADLEDGKFQRPECLGMDRILKGWGKEGVADEEILARGGACFDGLYAFLRRL